MGLRTAFRFCAPPPDGSKKNRFFRKKSFNAAYRKGNPGQEQALKETHDR
jgi:hypothetical protein